MTTRLKKGLIGGTVLGILCVIGAYVRSGFTATPTFIFSLWYNRVVLGLVVGAPWGKTVKSKALLRGGVLGIMVSFAFYCATGFADLVSFLAGGVYGVLLEAWLAKDPKK
ncbi:hypothetical protein SDC9_49248 [bioreactor metagenome]|uniref:Uncharacterized protein n=1 Tax=bioreactor metagenome TaxID=1076179 RepID=A0A644WHB5_9ZZZZ